MPITRTPWIDDDGTGTTGTIINNAEKQTLYNQIDEALGVWQPVPFDVANFWPGVTAAHVPINCRAQIGSTMFWIVQVVNAPAPAPPTSYLPFIIPDGRALFNGNAVMVPAAQATDAGVNGGGVGFALASNTVGFAKWQAASTWDGPNVSLYFTAILGLA